MAKDQVKVFEVGPRDGLQNEPRKVPLDLKRELILGLVRSGLREIETGAFVREDRVPQMAESEKLFQTLPRASKKLKGVKLWALVPNLKGLERAVSAGVDSIAVFTAASETFNKKNIGMSIQESLSVYREVIHEAKTLKLSVRGYVSTCFVCPYEGDIAPRKALSIIEKLCNLGIDEVSIGDTIGKASPRSVDSVVKPALAGLGKERVAVHFHDTYGLALANTLRAMEWGVRTVDSSVGGLGGCPFAPGATGNLATEDLVWMLDQLGVESGVSFTRLCETSLAFSKTIGRPLTSRALQAYLSARTMDRGQKKT